LRTERLPSMIGVHQRLGERRIVGLVVAAAAVADQVDHDVLVEGLPELERQASDPDALPPGSSPLTWKIGACTISRDIRGVDRGAQYFGAGREAHLVVDHDVHGAAGAVALQLGQVQGLGHDALAREGRIAVDEHRQHVEALAPAAAGPAWPGRCPPAPG
jgi:hypothetical protein